MVVKVIELVGVSEQSFEDAVNQAVSRAAKTLKNITGVDVIGQSAVVKHGRVAEYRVNLKIAFFVDQE